MKSLKFQPHLVSLIKNGEKFNTWRLFDDKNLQAGDIIELYENGADKPFSTAKITEIIEKPLGLLVKKDWEGHERFSTNEEMYETYRKYYGPSVGPKTLVKIIWFDVLAES